MPVRDILKCLSFRGMLFALLLPGCFYARAATEWEPVTPPVADAPAVVEFFSFYCPPCYAFSQTMNVDQAIRLVLPEGEQMVKYHVSLLGSLGPELTRAWALARVMNVTEPVEKAFFKANMVEKSLSSPTDIRRVFTEATGITGEDYDRKIKSPEVDEVVALQERLFREYDVQGTPAVYVRGQYHMNNGAFGAGSVEAFRSRYAAAVLSLLAGGKDAG